MAESNSITKDDRTTASDAIALLNLARIGSLVTVSGNRLQPANLPYLRELRNRIFEWSDSIEKEISRLEAVQAREQSTQFCGCDPGADYTCEQHRTAVGA